MMDAFTVDWSEQEFTEVRPGIMGATVETPQLTVTLYRYGAGSSWEERSHGEDQISTVLEGEIDSPWRDSPRRRPWPRSHRPL